MKHLISFFLLIGFTNLFAQGFNYKALNTDSNGLAVSNQNVVVRFTVLNGANTAVYEETHNVSTDANGILSVNVGEGSVVGGDFTMIDWGSDTYFLKTEIDLNDGNGWQDFGTTAFKYVPYAKYAETGDYRGLTHKPGVWYSSVTYNPATNSTEPIYRTGALTISTTQNTPPSPLNQSKLYVYDSSMSGTDALITAFYDGADSGNKYGNYIKMQGNGSSHLYGAFYDLVVNGNTGELTGTAIKLQIANDNGHMGNQIEISGAGNGDHFGQRISLFADGTGHRLGQLILLDNAGTSYDIIIL